MERLYFIIAVFAIVGLTLLGYIIAERMYKPSIEPESIETIGEPPVKKRKWHKTRNGLGRRQPWH